MFRLDFTVMEQIEAEEKALKEILKGNIRKFRQRRNLSQFALASKTDLSTNFLADIEAGKTWVSAGTLIKLAKAFEIDAYELLKPETKLPSAKDLKILDNFTKDLSETLKTQIDKQITTLKKHYQKND
jgi:transcriptional regulator with XRE-family HTH domain